MCTHHPYGCHTTPPLSPSRSQLDSFRLRASITFHASVTSNSRTNTPKQPNPLNRVARQGPLRHQRPTHLDPYACGCYLPTRRVNKNSSYGNVNDSNQAVPGRVAAQYAERLQGMYDRAISIGVPCLHLVN